MAAVLEAALKAQAKQCSRWGSVLYGGLLDRIAAEVAAGMGGVCTRTLRPFANDPPQSQIALRLVAAVNRLALDGRAEDLAQCYRGDILNLDETWARFTQVVNNHQKELSDLIKRPLRINDPGRAAALLPGFLEAARQTGFPLRIMEAGAGAGMNLRWDHYFYEAQDVAWGKQGSSVLLRGVYRRNHPSLEGEAHVIERSGCDEHPLFVSSEEDRLTLLSAVWPDQTAQVQRMTGAIELARRVPVLIDTARAEEWIEQQLKTPATNRTTVVFHTLLLGNLSPKAVARLQFVMEEAGKRATANTPLAWLRMEAGGAEAEVRLRIWPGGKDRVIAFAGFHGQWIEAPGSMAGGASASVRLS